VRTYTKNITKNVKRMKAFAILLFLVLTLALLAPSLLGY